MDYRSSGFRKDNRKFSQNKNFKRRYDPFYEENKERINDLIDEVQSYSRIINESLSGDHEDSFLEDNQGKLLTIHLLNGDVFEGILEDITNFGIIISNDEGKHFYYKHIIESYNLKD